MECELFIDSTEVLHDGPISPLARKTRTGRTPGKTPTTGDRFIPTRSAMDIEISHFNLMKENEDPNQLTPSKAAYKQHLATALFDGKVGQTAKILSFKNKAPAPSEDHINQQRVLYSLNKDAQQKKSTRYVAETPFKILDAPNFADDYYVNVVDWSKENSLAIGLGSSVYLFDATSGAPLKLTEFEDQTLISSVNWSRDGRHLGLGLSSGVVEIWDPATQKPLKRLRGHDRRVAALAWNGYVLSAGGKNGQIHNHDVRIRNSLVQTLEGHSQEVCGLKWSLDGQQLASGGNDNVVNIWDVNHNQGVAPKFTFTDHIAAVKGIAWCPWQKDLLATGGGAADRTMKFWNTTTGALLNSVDTGSQVSQLVWSKTSGCREIVSAHGYANNQLIVWKYPSLSKVAELQGHSQRIVSLAQSPDGSTVVSGSADETLCFWNIFPSVNETASVKKASTKVASPKIKTPMIR